MSALDKYVELTLQLLDIVKNESDQDKKIQQIESLLAERETIIKNIVPPFTQEEQALGKELVVYEETLQALLNKEKKIIQQEIKNISIRKQSTKKYTNPYESLSTDGIFYDKQK